MCWLSVKNAGTKFKRIAHAWRGCTAPGISENDFKLAPLRLSVARVIAVCKLESAMARRTCKFLLTWLIETPRRLPLAICLPLLLGTTAWANASLPTPNTAETSLKPSASSVAAFANDQIPEAMRNGDIPGAVFVVVRGSSEVFQKGYGLANVEHQKPVSAKRTLFRVASISKILTAASALQLANQHRVDLHRNVNHYLTGFQIRPAFGKPITLFDLLTHSSGFDIDWFGYAARSAARKLSLQQYLVAHQPARVRSPGLFSGYDNYGYALAGYLVQKVSGIPFTAYVKARLLGPLGMDHSSFAPRARLRQQLATGYWLDDQKLRPYGRSYVNITPAAGLCTTAADMSRLLEALLTDRRPDGSRAFATNVVNGLLKQQFAFDPAVPGRCFGFDCVTMAGRRVLRQTGQWPGFNSFLLLLPHEHCGVFLAYNLCDHLGMGRQIVRSFIGRFFPAKPSVTKTVPDPKLTQNAAKLLRGSYISVSFPQASPELGFPPEKEVTQSPEGELEIDGQPYREIGTRVFERIARDASGAPRPGKRVAFRLDSDGGVADLITEGGAFRRAAWSETRRGRMALARVVWLVFLSALVLWPIMYLVRLISANTARDTLPAGSAPRLIRISRLARMTALVACALALWVQISLLLTELRLAPFADLYGLPASIQHLLWLMPALMGLTIALVAFSAIAWRCRLWNLAHRVHYTLIPLALLVFFYLFNTRHLLFVG